MSYTWKSLSIEGFLISTLADSHHSSDVHWNLVVIYLEEEQKIIKERAEFGVKNSIRKGYQFNLPKVVMDKQE